MRDIRGLPVFKNTKITLELLRLEYRGNIAKAYLPYLVKQALKLDPEKDKALVMLHDEETGISIIIKDTELLEKAKPMVLNSRRLIQEVKKSVNKTNQKPFV